MPMPRSRRKSEAAFLLLPETAFLLSVAENGFFFCCRKPNYCGTRKPHFQMPMYVQAQIY
jgi:hypothetical protein